MGTGVDQLYHSSVHPGYLKILQMGGTDPRHKSRKTKYELDQSINWQIKSSLYTTHGQSAGGNHRSVIIGARQPITAQWVFFGVTFLATRAWLRPVSRGNRHFTVGGGRLRQSGPRPKARLLRQPKLEGLTRSARTDSPRPVGWNKFRRSKAAAAAFERGEGPATFELGLGSRTPQNPLLILNTLSSVSVRESRIQYLCDPKWFRDTASRGPTTIVAPESQFRTCPSDHDSIGYPRMSASGESSTTMHRLLHASGSHPIPPPNDPK
ncbi:hypothetical protein F511_09983 [Dorcoceras hygrometricum]|uniref:Uncharacterized protein n=1 Tax=Dorcoceras hygrometricum TaxID=472368 RepID=A0A2Z7D9U9_9LAMI|nr:hypothetical protein F511_09983 [Dorcoceras hygrometricum]